MKRDLHWNTDNLWCNLSRMKLGFSKHFRVKIIIWHFQKNCISSAKNENILLLWARDLIVGIKCLISVNWLTWIWRSRFFLTKESAISPKIIYHPYFCKNTTENMYPSKFASITKVSQVILFTCDRCSDWVLLRRHVWFNFRSRVRHF